MGVGSEGIVTLRNKRKFIGTELNPAYYHQAIKNLKDDGLVSQSSDLFEKIAS